MSYYYYKRNIKGVDISISVHLNDKDKERNILIFFYEDSQYLGVARYNKVHDGTYFNILEDYSYGTDVDFEEEVQYFLDIIYGADR